MESGPKEKLGGVKLDVCDIRLGNMTEHGKGKGEGGWVEKLARNHGEENEVLSWFCYVKRPWKSL